MSVYISSACLSGYANVVEAVKHLHQAGIRCIEIGSGSKPGPDFKGRLPAYSCNYLIHNYFPPPRESFVLNLASADPVIRQRSLDLAQQAIELSAELGAPFYSIHAGFITDPYTFGNGHFLFPDASEPEARRYAFERFVSTLSIADRYAHKHQIGLLVENNVCWPNLRGKLLLQSADEFLELFDTLNSDNIGILLDFGHLNVSAQTLSFGRLEFIERLASHIHAFHVHDNDGTADTHQPVQADSWVVGVLRQKLFDHLPVIIEAKFETMADLHRHVDWLKENLGRE